MGTPEVLAFFGTVIAALLSGNVYFVKRLVDRLDETSKAQSETKTQLTGVKSDVSNVSGQIRDLKEEIKEIRKIEIQVAVLKSQFNSIPQPSN